MPRKTKPPVAVPAAQPTVVQLDFLVGPKEITEFELKDANLRKANVQRAGESEGLWIWLNDADLQKYSDDNDHTSIIIGVLANHALNGIPWGAFVPFRLGGLNRPTCVMDEMLDLKKRPIYHPEAKKQIDAAMKKEAAKAKKKKTKKK